MYFARESCLLPGRKKLLIPLLSCACKVLLAKNIKVYIVARNEGRTKAAIDDLKQTTGKEAIWLKLDLSSLNSVKASAEDLLGWVRSNSEWAYPIRAPARKGPELRILFNNACVSLFVVRGQLNLYSETVPLWVRHELGNQHPW